MSSINISYSPRDVSFMIKDEVTSNTEAYAKNLIGDEGSLNMELEEDVYGNFSYKSIGGSIHKFSDRDIDKVISFLAREYDPERYSAHIQMFLMATNLITGEQNVVPTTRADGERAVASSLINPGAYVYSMREVQALYDSYKGHIIYEKFRSPDSYVQWNHKEIVIDLPVNCVKRRDAVRVVEDLGSIYLNFIVLNATEVENMSASFVDSLSDLMLERSSNFEHLLGIRLRGFSGKFCRMFASKFEWRGENFISW